jgi:3-deoxy-D-manno-octulosonic acid kinase
MATEQKSTATGVILYDPAQVGKPTEEIFEVAYWEGRNKIVARASGRGGVIFVREESRYWVLRHYRRGGLIAKLLSDCYFWLGLERTRAFREWRLLDTLHAQGLPVPAPVAARVARKGLIYRADLITNALPAARTLSDTITGATLSENQWRGIGATIASFHCAGVHHADLNAHNILLGESGKVFLLDFDRGRIRSRGAWENDVLARLKRSLLKIQRQRQNVNFGERDWQALRDEYERRIADSR